MTHDSDDSSGPRPKQHPRVHVPSPADFVPPAPASRREPSRSGFAPRSWGGEKKQYPERPESRERPAARPEAFRASGPRHGFRYRVDLEYMGTRYSGWQFQTNARTVAGDIMEAIHRATGQRVIEVYGSGRTDAGVHAIHQVAHIDLAKAVDPDDFMRAVNDELPGDINLLKVELAPEGFHARHSATARTYLYRISTRRSAFDKPVVWWVKDSLDVSAMAAAARSLCGLHDFAAFAQSDPSRPDESTKVKVEAVEVFEQGPNIYIRIQGSHFLWKMVRRIVGVLVEVGRGRLTPADVSRIMAADGRLGRRVHGAALGPGAREGDLRRSGVRCARSPETRPRIGKRRASKPGFRPSGERSGAGGGRPSGGWPRRSASPESPRGPGTQTFRRRG
jgi:tRNA pseudouridine38-40 synthase